MWVWLVPLQAAAAFTVFAIAAGGQVLRTWLLSALVWLMAMPLFVGLEAGLIAMMLFEPVRGVARRAQYLFVDYAAEDPIHLLTPIVTLCALVLLLRSRRLEIFVATPLAGAVSTLAAIYFLEIFNPLQGGVLSGLGGALFMLIPLVWFYFGQSVDEAFVNRILRLMIVIAIITSAYGIYQLRWGYPAFEQFWIDHTDNYDSINVGHVQRALATFSSAEEWGRYAEIAAIAAFGFVAGQKGLLRRAGWFIAGIGLVGAVFLTGQRTAIFGLLAGIGSLILLGAISFPRMLMRLALVLIPIILIVAFVSPPSEEEMWSKSNNESISTVLSHAERGTLKPADEESFQARMENWTDLITNVIPSHPLGLGLGAGSLGRARFNSAEATLNPIDCFILVVGISSGIPAALLFIWILGRGIWLAFGNARAAVGDGHALTHRIVAAIMVALVLNSIFGLTFSLYSVAPLAWLFIGWISRERLRLQQEPEREIITI